jgi:hypothetical protein
VLEYLHCARKKLYILFVISIQCWVGTVPKYLTVGGSGINIPDHFPELPYQFFGLKILKFFVADADPDPGAGAFLTLDPGSRIEKIRFGIRYGINIPDPQHYK